MIQIKETFSSLARNKIPRLDYYRRTAHILRPNNASHEQMFSNMITIDGDLFDYTQGRDRLIDRTIYVYPFIQNCSNYSYRWDVIATKTNSEKMMGLKMIRR